MMYITTTSKTNTNTNPPVLKIVLKVGQQFYLHHLAFAMEMQPANVLYSANTSQIQLLCRNTNTYKYKI